jgi:hypothetical protein
MRLAKRAAFGVIHMIPVPVRRVYLQLELDDCRARISRKLLEEFGDVVQYGPFKGMEILSESFWHSGNRLPKLLGSYESELHPWISQIEAKHYDTILNIGCAEGYYAVGMARLSPLTKLVLAYDISPVARHACAVATAKNHVQDRVKVFGRCTPESLEETLSRGGRSFAFVDCEGGELELLCPDRVPTLRNTDILVECHDFVDRSLTDTLYRRLSPTHSIERVDEGPCDPNQFPFLKGLSGIERSLAVCEFRQEMMHWLLCTSKVTGSS